MALMIVLALIMGGGVFFVAGAAAREVRVAELKSNFVASVSHDLKTPLALIQLFAETLELGRVRNAERAQEYYRIINGEARKLTRLIENILDFSKMEAGLRPYRVAPADVGELTRQVLSAMDSQFTQGHFNVRTHRRSGAAARPRSTDDAVEQALENVLANAMKYSGESRDIDVHVGRAERARLRAASPITASASRGASRNESSASSTASTAVWAAGRRAAVSAWPSSTTPCAATAASSTSTASPTTAARFTLHFPIPAGADRGGRGS